MTLFLWWTSREVSVLDNYDLMKSFLSRLVVSLNIHSDDTRVALVTYSSYVGTSFNLNAYSSRAAVQWAISSLVYSGGLTDTAAALAYVRTTMLTPEAGDRSNVSNVVVVFTDGASNNRTATKVSSGVDSIGLRVQAPLPQK